MTELIKISGAWAPKKTKRKVKGKLKTNLAKGTRLSSSARLDGMVCWET